MYFRTFQQFAAIVIGAMVSTLFSIWCNVEPALAHMKPGWLPGWTAGTLTVICNIAVQFLVTGFLLWLIWYRVKRRAGGLLRKLITPQQYDTYLREGIVVEKIHGWTAIIHTNGIAWNPTCYGRGYWECIYPADRSLCKEDKIISLLLYARQANFLKTHVSMILSG